MNMLSHLDEMEAVVISIMQERERCDAKGRS